MCGKSPMGTDHYQLPAIFYEQAKHYEAEIARMLEERLENAARAAIGAS